MQTHGADFEATSDSIRLDNLSWECPARSVVIRRSDQILPFCLLKLNRDMAAESTAKAVLTARNFNQIKPEKDATTPTTTTSNNTNSTLGTNGETTNGHSTVKLEPQQQQNGDGDFFRHRTKRGHGQFKGLSSHF